MNTTTTAHDLKIVHVMADGEIRDSVAGLVPPAETGCYEALRRIVENHMEGERKCS